MRSVFTLIIAAGFLALPFSSTPKAAPKAQELELPILEKADTNLDTCALGEVSGLNPKGDGFLSVRTGPAASYAEIDRLKNGARVWVFSGVGDWMGVIYGVETLDCGPILKNRIAPQKGKKGWIHSKWVKIIAG